MTAKRDSRVVALDLLNRGFAPIPVPPRSKAPTIKGWQRLRIGHDEIPKYFTNGENIGILNGEPSGWRVDVDLDASEALAVADHLLPITGAVFGRPSNLRSHRIYISPDSKTKQFQDPRAAEDKAMLVELRCNGQTIAPGSLHPSGERIEWSDDGAPEVIAADDLTAAVGRVAAAALLARYWPKGSRHGAALALAGGLHRLGWSQEDIERFVGAVGQAADDEEIRDRLLAVGDTAKRKGTTTGWKTLGEIVGADIVGRVREWLGATSATETDLPTIIIRNKLSGVVDEAEAVLCAADRSLYERGNVLVRVTTKGKRIEGIEKPEGTPVVIPADPAWIRDRVDRVATWARRADGGDLKPGLPPRWVGETIAARRGEGFPSLEAVTETPVLLRDGRVLQEPGYDSKSGILFVSEVEYPRIPDEPTPGDGGRAILELVEPFAEFPFVDPAAKSAAVAAILTLLARPAIPGPVPMFTWRGPTPGSGKGLGADVGCLIGTGRTAAMMAPPRSGEETDKQILALALEGVQAVCIDNISGAFGSDALASALTTTVKRGRILGLSKTASVPHRIVWMSTGNNLVFKGDLGRRVVPIDIDPKVEHPEDRTFKRSDLLAWVRAEQPRLTVAALTILRAYHVVGQPAHGKPRKGSFEAWDDLVRGCLLWVGAADPLGGVERIRDEGDADLDLLREALAAWHGAFSPEAKTTTEAMKGAENDDDLRSALAGLADCPEKRLDARRLGYALRRVKDRPVNGLRFTQGTVTAHGGIKRWRVAEER